MDGHRGGNGQSYRLRSDYMKDQIDGLATKLELLYKSDGHDKLRVDKLEDEVCVVKTKMAKRKEDINALSIEAGITSCSLKDHVDEVFRLKEHIIADEKRLLALEELRAKSLDDYSLISKRLDKLEIRTACLPETIQMIKDRLDCLDQVD